VELFYAALSPHFLLAVASVPHAGELLNMSASGSFDEFVPQHYSTLPPSGFRTQTFSSPLNKIFLSFNAFAFRIHPSAW